MGVLGVSYCDFFVYTTHGYHLERISFNLAIWEKLLENCSNFWTEYVAPELLSGSLANKLHPSICSADDHSYQTKHTESANAGHENQTAAESRQALPSTSTAKPPLAKSTHVMVFLCGVCGGDVEMFQLRSQCSKCRLCFHAPCLGLPSGTVMYANWVCPQCIEL